MSASSTYAANVADLEMAKGLAQANAQRQNAAGWGNTIATLGQVIPQQVQQAMQQAAQKQKAQQIQQILTEAGDDYGSAIPKVMAIDPKLGNELAERWNTAQKNAYEHQTRQRENQRKDLEFLSNLVGSSTDPLSYEQARTTARLAGIDVSQIPAEFDPKVVESFNRQLMTAKQRLDSMTPPEPKLIQIETVNDKGQPVTKFVTPTTDAEYPKPAPKPANAPNVGSFEDYVTRTYGVSPTPEQVLKARKDYQQADDRPARITVNSGGDVDTNAIADAIIAGDQPPTLQGLYGKGAAVRSALAKKGYSLATAQTDWTATQKHIATLNGAQQTRMGQAIDNAAHSLDVIEELANQWDGGRFPLLNKATLVAAKQGAMGAKAQQIATQLEAQISDVTSELGNVYMGGNSPTDHALTLAAKNLSADWSKAQLKSALDLARKNLQIRQNSMRNVGVAGASAGNPYAPQQPSTPAAAPAGGAMLTYQDYLKSKGGK